MEGKKEVLFSLAGRIHSMLRRHSNRIIDVEWLCSDATYALEVIRLARADGTEELQKLADRIEEVHPLLHRIKPRVVENELDTADSSSKYIISLR